MAKKILGPRVPCKKGKYHSVGMGSGICSNCGKQIHKSDPKRLASFMQMGKDITKTVFE